MSIAYALATVAFLAGFIWLSIRADRKAAHRRAERLRSRDRVSLDEWQRSLPNIPASTLREIVELIAGVFLVPVHFLRPSDSFHNELALADGFFFLVSDDDTTGQICDVAEERYGVRPRGDWNSLSDAVLEIWPLL
jgi:hypothetical protein